MSTCQTSFSNLYGNYFIFSVNRPTEGQSNTPSTEILELMVQKVNLPGLTVPDVPQPTTLGITIPVPTLAVQYESLNVEFLVDGQLENWKSLYSWMRNLANIENDTGYNLDTYQQWHGSASLILPQPIDCDTPSPNLTVSFSNLVPTRLTGLIFQADVTDAPILKASCSFRFSHYTISPDLVTG